MAVLGQIAAYNKQKPPLLAKEAGARTTEVNVNFQTQCNTKETPSTIHAHKAAKHLLGAKVEIVRAIWITSKESPTYRRLQQLAGAVSLLIGIVEPLAKDEPAEISQAGDQQMEVSQ
jgi:hypothetical protein